MKHEEESKQLLKKGGIVMKLIEWEVNEDNYQEQIVIPEAQRKLAEKEGSVLKTSRKLLCEYRI